MTDIVFIPYQKRERRQTRISKITGKKLLKKSDLKWWKEKAIDRAKAKVRSRGICDKCGKSPKILHGSHVRSVRHNATAADIDNIMCLCYFCHIRWWHQYPMEAADWFKSKWPGRYERLLAKSMTDVDYTAEDWERICNALG